MNRIRLNTEKALPLLQLFFILCWLSRLSGTDSYYSAYALCGIVSLYCLWENRRDGDNLRCLPRVLGLIISWLLSLASVLANYPLFQVLRNDVSPATNLILNWIAVVSAFAGGAAVFYQIFLYGATRFPKTCVPADTKGYSLQPWKVFASWMLPLSAVYLVYLIFVSYPGNVTSDAWWQIEQTITGNYSVHHPFWHTMCIKLFMTLGYGIFQDVNAAAATFNGVQALAAAACFSYALTTLYQYRVPKAVIVCVFAMFLCLPHHITYSATMWKDVPFGLTMLLFTVAMFRLIRGVGKNRILNYAMFLLGGVGSAVFRTNGGYALAAAFLILVLFFRKKCKELLVPWVAVLLVGWIMIGPAMTWLDVKRNNFLEGLSVPMQQIALVIVEDCPLTEEETQMLSRILDLERVPEVYWAQCCDPIKEVIRDEDPSRLAYLMEHQEEYAKLWLQLGQKYPWVYLRAWVEETKGYWNGGYDYYIYSQYVQENDWGMYMVPQNNPIHDLVKAYFTITRETVLFQPLQSIGLNIWILSLLCFLTMAWGKKEFLLTMPVIAVVFTLWLTTPVFSEFRYAYSIFTCLPFILPVTLWGRPDDD